MYPSTLSNIETTLVKCHYETLKKYCRTSKTVDSVQFSFMHIFFSFCQFVLLCCRIFPIISSDIKYISNCLDCFYFIEFIIHFFSVLHGFTSAEAILTKDQYAYVFNALLNFFECHKNFPLTSSDTHPDIRDWINQNSLDSDAKGIKLQEKSTTFGAFIESKPADDLLSSFSSQRNIMTISTAFGHSQQLFSPISRPYFLSKPKLWLYEHPPCVGIHHVYTKIDDDYCNM